MKRLMVLVLAAIVLFSAGFAASAAEIRIQKIRIEDPLEIIPKGYAAVGTEVDQLTEEERQNYENAVASLRQQLVERKESITVILKNQDAVAPETLFEDALAHTGVGNEGDYIRCCLLHKNGSYNLSENGEWVYSFEMKYRTTWEQEQLTTEMVNQVLDSLQGETIVETMDNICKYLAQNVTYDTYFFTCEINHYPIQSSVYNVYKQTAYGAMVNKTAVCEGFAALFYRLCLESGIDTRMIYGSLAGVDHAWNIADVTGNREYYFFDPTNDYWFRGNEQYDLGNEHGKYYIPDAEYTTSEFMAAYPMADGPYGAQEIDCSFDEDTGLRILLIWNMWRFRTQYYALVWKHFLVAEN